MSNTKAAKLEGQVTVVDGQRVCFAVEPFAVEPKLEKIVEILFTFGDLPKICDPIMLCRKVSSKQGWRIDPRTPVDASVYIKVKTNNLVSYRHIGTASIEYGDLNGK